MADKDNNPYYGVSAGAQSGEYSYKFFEKEFQLIPGGHQPSFERATGVNLTNQSVFQQVSKSFGFDGEQGSIRVQGGGEFGINLKEKMGLGAYGGTYASWHTNPTGKKFQFSTDALVQADTHRGITAMGGVVITSTAGTDKFRWSAGVDGGMLETDRLAAVIRGEVSMPVYKTSSGNMAGVFGRAAFGASEHSIDPSIQAGVSYSSIKTPIGNMGVEGGIQWNGGTHNSMVGTGAIPVAGGNTHLGASAYVGLRFGQ